MKCIIMQNTQNLFIHRFALKNSTFIKVWYFKKFYNFARAKLKT